MWAKNNWKRGRGKSKIKTKKLEYLKNRFLIRSVHWKNETSSITIKYNFSIKWKNIIILIKLYWLLKRNKYASD